MLPVLLVFAIVTVGLGELIPLLVELLILVCICLVLYWCVQKFAPDDLLRRICYLIIFIIVLFGLLDIFGVVAVH